MDYTGFCQAVEEFGLKHVRDVSSSYYLTQAQKYVYIIGRINEDLRRRFPDAEFQTDSWFDFDHGDITKQHWFVSSIIYQNDRAFQYQIRIIQTYLQEGSDYEIEKKERPYMSRFQDRVQKYSLDIFAELTVDASLSSSEFITKFEKALIDKLEETYDRKGFEVSLTVSHGKRVVYTASVEDTIDGAEVTLEIGREDYITSTEEKPGLKWTKDFSLEAVYKEDPEFFNKLSKVRATIEFSRIATNALTDAFLTNEEAVDNNIGASAIHDHVAQKLQEAAPPCEFTIKVEVENRTATLHVEEATTKVKFRLRATRELDTAE